MFLTLGCHKVENLTLKSVVYEQTSKSVELLREGKWLLIIRSHNDSLSGTKQTGK